MRYHLPTSFGKALDYVLKSGMFPLPLAVIVPSGELFCHVYDDGSFLAIGVDAESIKDLTGGADSFEASDETSEAVRSGRCTIHTADSEDEIAELVVELSAKYPELIPFMTQIDEGTAQATALFADGRDELPFGPFTW